MVVYGYFLVKDNDIKIDSKPITDYIAERFPTMPGWYKKDQDNAVSPSAINSPLHEVESVDVTIPELN